MDYNSPIIEYFADIVEEYLGDLIEEVIEHYYEDRIDISSEYEDILEYIINKLIQNSLHGNHNPENFEKLVRKMSKRRGVGKLVISYLISEYLRENNEIGTE